MHRRVAPPSSLVLFFYYATFTRENNARAHFTRVICSPGCPRPPPSPLFVACCSRGKEEERGWTVAPKACQSTCPTLTSLSELKRTLPTRRSHFAPHRPPKPTSIPALTFLVLRRYLRPSAIYLVKLAWNAHMLANGRTHTYINDKTIKIHIGYPKITFSFVGVLRPQYLVDIFLEKKYPRWFKTSFIYVGNNNVTLAIRLIR